MRKNVSIVQLVIQLVQTFALFGKKKPDKKGRPQMFLQGIDYQYCKGCLKCVHACPVDALSSAVKQMMAMLMPTVYHIYLNL